MFFSEFDGTECHSDWNVTPIGYSATTPHPGDLFSFEMSFSQPGTFVISLVEFLDVDRTYFSNPDVENFYWGDISNVHPFMSNVVYVSEN